jgi:hypothetical protein
MESNHKTQFDAVHVEDESFTKLEQNDVRLFHIFPSGDVVSLSIVIQFEAR